MKVLSMTISKLQQLHDLTGCNFFACDSDEHTVIPTIAKQDGKYIYGVDKLKEKFPDIDLSGFTQVTYKPQTDIG